VKTERRFVNRVETLDQMVEVNYLVLRLFFFHDANEILERGLYGDATKPGSIVVDGTDVVDDGSD
jgi:hypothetical protein